MLNYNNKFTLFNNLFDNSLDTNSSGEVNYENLQLNEQQKIDRRNYLRNFGFFGREIFNNTMIDGKIKL